MKAGPCPWSGLVLFYLTCTPYWYLIIFLAPVLLPCLLWQRFSRLLQRYLLPQMAPGRYLASAPDRMHVPLGQ
ncbi:hypothetical protein LMH87_005352 [Akanthomyces muscarius]|uniref:Uncharacterized protein n=1 Tax=Akanthomyces muscarius TaxID=2231603 RepID=A0A9W8QP04_AKAMU|nr:hypothetical protein LMH87_005352 [Akanthomyces muscarius]KAJ4163637.1 hypothetical protein LMH87_005352 [Akanthomyces muscarius]